jgi:predicted amidophosphoribosyltransferase
MGPDRKPTTCPDCAGPVWPERERLCPRCGYPLMFLQQESEPEGMVVARAPGEQVEATSTMPAPHPVPEEQTDVPVGAVSCPRCAYRSAPTRVRCERCGQELRPPQAQVPPPFPPAPPPPGGVPLWLILLCVLLVLAVAVFVAVLLVLTQV